MQINENIDSPSSSRYSNRWIRLRLMFKAFMKYKNEEKTLTNNFSNSKSSLKSPSLLASLGSTTLKRKKPSWTRIFRSRTDSFESGSRSVSKFTSFESQSSGVTEDLPNFEGGDHELRDRFRDRSESKESTDSAAYSNLSLWRKRLSKQSTIKAVDVIEPWIPVWYIARLKMQCGGTKAIDLFEKWPEVD